MTVTYDANQNKFCKKCNCHYPLTEEFWKSRSDHPHLVRCRTCENKHTKQWREENTEKSRQIATNYYRKNREYCIKRNGEYSKNRRKIDVGYKLAMRLRSRISQQLRRKGIRKVGSHIANLGCTLSELKAHLESQFVDGMSWDNYGRDGWHVDHILPLASFDLTDEAQFKIATHYTNLQPLWAIDNIKKGDTL